MEMWNSIEGLRSLSHSLMWGAVIFAVLAAVSTGVRYYVDRRAGELSSHANRVGAEQKEQAQREREASLKLQVEAAQREQQEANEKLSKIEQNVRGRHLTSEQSATLAAMAKQVCRSFFMVNVTASNSNHEAQMYATEFVKALKAGGCVADLALPIPGLTPDVIGIHVGVRDTQKPASGAVELSKMLNRIGIKFLVSQIKPDFFPDVSFVLVVGAK
jgi:outer membrane murein-binding lipoprotein Lpp